MRRSVAGQIEYWATLGRALEHAGLSTQDSKALISREDVALHAIPAPMRAMKPSTELDDLHAHVLALSQSGALAERAKAAVAENRAKAVPRTRARDRVKVAMPVFHLIAGPNGAGKSTLYRYLIQPRYPQLTFLDADVYEREQLGHVRDALERSEAARAWADAQRGAHLLARVRDRVQEGGHSVPANKILERYPRTVGNLQQAVKIVDLAMLFDATGTDVGDPLLVASVKAGDIRLHGTWQPAWARKVLGTSNGQDSLTPSSAPRSHPP